MADNQIPNVLCLDTEPLRRSKWPQLSAGLRAVLELATKLGMEIWIPVAVVEELSWQFDSEVEAAAKQAKGALKELNDRFGLPTGDAQKYPLKEDVKLRHAQIVEAFRNDYGVVMVPLTGRSLEYILSRAVRKEPPFDEKGKGFPDTVIALSLIDHLRHTGAGSAILVTADTDYRGVEKLAADEGVSVVVMNLDETQKTLQGHLTGMALKFFQERIEEARQAALAAKGMLEEFARGELEVPWRPGINEVLDLRLGDLRAVTTNPALEAVEPGNEVRFEIDFDARLRVTKTVEAPWPDVRLRVGDKAEERLNGIALRMVMAGKDKPTVEQRDLDEVVVFEAMGQRTEAGYTVTKPLSVRVLGGSIGDMIRRTLSETAKKGSSKAK